MSANSKLQKAGEHLAENRYRKALACAWEGADVALRDGDPSGITRARDIAVEVAEFAGTDIAEDALKLANFCQSCLDGFGGGIQPTSDLGRVFRRSRRRACPDCAESIAIAARMCRHCGMRFDRS